MLFTSLSQHFFWHPTSQSSVEKTNGEVCTNSRHSAFSCSSFVTSVDEKVHDKKNRWLTTASLLATTSLLYSSTALAGAAVWTNGTTGTLDGIGVTVAYSSTAGSPSSSDLSGANFSYQPLNASQSILNYSSNQNLTITFVNPVSNLLFYPVYFRGTYCGGVTGKYTFSSTPTIVSGLTSATLVGNELTVGNSNYHNGILSFSGSISTLTMTTDCTGGSSQAFTLATLSVPASPSGLTATVVSATQIDLAWTDNSGNEAGFKIFRNGVELTPSPKVGTNATATATHSDTGLTCGTTYNYEVKATNAAGDSTAVTASATTVACPPASTSTGTPATLLDPTYTLTIKTSGKGTGMIGYQTSDITGKAVGSLTECSKPEGCTYTLPTTSWIKLTAVPTGDSLFSGFGGNDSHCTNGLIFVDQKAECTAYFDPKPVPVTTPPTGTTTPPAGTTTPPAGTTTPPTGTTTPPTGTTTPPTGTTTPPTGTTTPPTGTTTPPTGTTTPPTGTTTPPTGTTTPPTGTTTPPTGTTTPPTGTTTPPTGTTTPPIGTTTPPTDTTTPPSTTPVVVIPITPIPDGTSSSSPNSSDGFCLSKDNTLNDTCDAKWVTITNFRVQERGNLARATVEGIITNEGWASNLKLKGKGTIKGGILTGFITCENDNVVTNVEFKGAVLKGCTLEGTILNTSRLEGKGLIQDVKLKAGAKVKGGRMGGKIEGDAKSPATLDWLEIDQGSELSNVIIGKHVSIAPGVKLDDSIQFESDSDK